MDQTKIWGHFQNDEDIAAAAFNSNARYQFIAKHIPKEAQALNIGAGTGGLEQILLKKGVKVCSLDPSEKTIRRLQQKLASQIKFLFQIKILISL